MLSRPTTLRAAFTTLLTVWMTAASLGVWVRHAHAGAATPHAHGWGWCPAGCSTLRPDGPSAPPQAHRHLVFCGIECPNESPADGDTPAAPADGVSVIDHPCERPTPVGLSALVTADPAPTLPPPSAHATPAVARDRFVSRHLPLSAFACRQVSGVLRS